MQVSEGAGSVHTSIDGLEITFAIFLTVSPEAASDESSLPGQDSLLSPSTRSCGT